jgi:hypothetical protein
VAIQIQDFRPFNKNTLQGFLTLRLTNVGIEIRDICLHEKAGKRWLAMPAKPYEKDGKSTYAFIINFYDRAKNDQFQELALEALDLFMATL